MVGINRYHLLEEEDIAAYASQDESRQDSF